MRELKNLVRPLFETAKTNMSSRFQSVSKPPFTHRAVLTTITALANLCLHLEILKVPSTKAEPQNYAFENVEIEVFTVLIQWLHRRNIHIKLSDDGKGTRTQE